jgi:hypothetical protein
MNCAKKQAPSLEILGSKCKKHYYGGMETEIYYFSGTGNLLFAARELQKRLPGSAILPEA